MNKNILTAEVQQFINSNLKTDITKVILKGSPFKNCTIQEIAEQISVKIKCQHKLPTWFTSKNIYYPSKVNIEQTSSEITATYKASLVSGKSLVDITGGFGADAYYFSKKIDKITHCEINSKLSNIVAHNFKSLKVKNCECVPTDGLQYIKELHSKADWIYADPSRRTDDKGKVFMLNDCLPNIPKNLDLLFKKSNAILLKLAPVLDITSAVKSLKFIKEIHIVALKYEVKELLFILKKNYVNSITVKTINIIKNTQQEFNFTYGSTVQPSFSEPQNYLYEPNAAILKSGCYNHISQHFSINKIHPNSHIYTSNSVVSFPGRCFKIIHTIPYTKKGLKKLIPSKKANITTRNFPETVTQIRKKTGIKDGGNIYLFFTTDINNKHIVIFCEKL